MAKELEPIQQLERQKESLSRGIGRINDIYLSDPVRIGSIEVGSSLSATLEIGRAKSAARKSVVGLGNRLEQVNSERANGQARDYIELERSLPELRQRVVDGDLPNEALDQYQGQFEELERLRDKDSLLQRAIERIRQEEEVKKPLIEMLPDGKARLPNGVEISGNRAKVLAMLGNTSECNMLITDQIARNVYPDREESAARGSICATLFQLKGRLSDAGIELVSVMPTPQEKFRGVKGSYYLRKLDREESAIENKKDQVQKDDFRFEDVLEVRGETAKLLNKLSPFGGDHIATRSELTQELSSSSGPIDAEVFDQHLRETREILNWRRYRLCELPNAEEPENNGYYVESIRRERAQITLLGEVVRYKDKENQVTQTRLLDDESLLLWKLAGGGAKTSSELEGDLSKDPRTVAESLNRSLGDLTGIPDVVVSVGDDQFGYWYKTKDAYISRRGYHRLHPTRQEALKLIFQDDAAMTGGDVIQALGPTRGERRPSRILTNQQAVYALRNSASRLSIRVREGIATEEEEQLYGEMQGYMEKYDLRDAKSLTSHISTKLGLAHQVASTQLQDILESSQIAAVDQSTNERVGDIDSVEEPVEDLTDDIEELIYVDDEEFGNLSRVDIAIIAHGLESNRTSIDSFLRQKGINLLEEDVTYELNRFIEEYEMSPNAQEARGDMNSEQFEQWKREVRIKAFEKAQKLITSLEFGQVMEEIANKNPSVWSLLLNLNEIDEALKNSGREKGIKLIADPDELKTVMSNLGIEISTDEDDFESGGNNGEQLQGDKPSVIFVTPAQNGGDKENKQNLTALEKRDTEIRSKINRYFDDISEKPELRGGSSKSSFRHPGLSEDKTTDYGSL